MSKHQSRERRGAKCKARIRISGKKRLVVFRSAKYIYAQIVEATPNGDKVLVSCSSIDKQFKSEASAKNKVEEALAVGKMLGNRATKEGITQVAFDRSGYKYHGRIKSLADGAREAGLVF